MREVDRGRGRETEREKETDRPRGKERNEGRERKKQRKKQRQLLKTKRNWQAQTHSNVNNLRQPHSKTLLNAPQCPPQSHTALEPFAPSNALLVDDFDSFTFKGTPRLPRVI